MRAIQQENGGVKHLIMQVVYLESLYNTGYILNEEWHMEHGVPGSFLEDRVRSHRVGLGKLAVLQDEICEEQLLKLLVDCK